MKKLLTEWRKYLNEMISTEDLRAFDNKYKDPQEVEKLAQTMKFSTKNIVEDKKSGEYRLSHHLDLKTGMYKGRQVLDPKE